MRAPMSSCFLLTINAGTRRDYTALGTEVTLMDRRDDLLRMLDQEIGALFLEEMKKLGAWSNWGRASTTCAAAKMPQTTDAWTGCSASFLELDQLSAKMVL